MTTYFFSTSGGETEDVENSFVGSQPKPWLKAVDDPFDSVSPKHRWGPFRFTATQVQRKLHRYLQGRFKRIKVLQRGVSPRVVRAQVVGTGGVTNVTGPQLRSAFGLFDTWAFFTSVTSKASKPKPAAKKPAATPAHAGRPDGRRLAGRARGRRARLAPGGDHRPGARRALGARRAPRGHALGRGDRRARSCAAGATRWPCRGRASTAWCTGRPWGRPCGFRRCRWLAASSALRLRRCARKQHHRGEAERGGGRGLGARAVAGAGRVRRGHASDRGAGALRPRSAAVVEPSGRSRHSRRWRARLRHDDRRSLPGHRSLASPSMRP